MITGLILGAVAAFLAGMFSATSSLSRGVRLAAGAALGAATMIAVSHVCIEIGLP